MGKERFLLQQSGEPLYWVVTDTEQHIVVKFREHQFNETQEVSFPKGVPSDNIMEAMKVATYLREMADWLRRNHYNIAMPSLLGKRADMGQLIEEIRIEQGLTQSQLATMAGITVDNLRRIEAGKYSIGIDLLNRIADALGKDLTIQ